MTLALQQLDASDAGFNEQIQKYIERARIIDTDIESTVRSIIDDVRTCGDEAILDYTKQFDQIKADSVSALRISAQRRFATC